MVECLRVLSYHLDYDRLYAVGEEHCVVVGYGGAVATCKQYILWKGNRFLLLQSKSSFLELYVPVQDENEALAFAVALTFDEPRYTISIPDGSAPLVPEIEPTSVRPSQEGYIVRLFEFRAMGCGPHFHFAMDYLVETGGDVTKISEEAIYEDIERRGHCID